VRFERPTLNWRGVERSGFALANCQYQLLLLIFKELIRKSAPEG